MSKILLSYFTLFLYICTLACPETQVYLPIFIHFRIRLPICNIVREIVQLEHISAWKLNCGQRRPKIEKKWNKQKQCVVTNGRG